MNRDWGAFLLAIGGTAAALVQALGHVRAAGGRMLAVNIMVAILSLAARKR